MTRLEGKGISPGYAEGKAFLVGVYQQERQVPYYTINSADVDSERIRFHEALQRSCQELEQVRDRVLSELGEAESQILMFHLAMLRDQEFSEKILNRVQNDLVNVEQALDLEIQKMVELLAEVESEYFRERRDDIRDVGRRVLKHLGIDKESISERLPPKSVLIARELLPSETLNLDRKCVVAIVTELGGQTSHSAILARSLEIPAATGVAVHLLANIARAEEALDVTRHNLEGVGLFRTEYLFFGATEPPPWEIQYEAYSRAAEQ